MAKQKQADLALDLPVKYGNVSVGVDTASIGIKIERSKLSLSKADQQLCGRRLIGTITSMPGNANPDQPALGGMDVEEKIEAAFDVASIGVKRKQFTATLSFKIKSVDPDTLVHFAQSSGHLRVTEIGDIPEKGEDGEDAEEEEDEE